MLCSVSGLAQFTILLITRSIHKPKNPGFGLGFLMQISSKSPSKNRPLKLKYGTTQNSKSKCNAALGVSEANSFFFYLVFLGRPLRWYICS